MKRRSLPSLALLAGWLFLTTHVSAAPAPDTTSAAKKPAAARKAAQAAEKPAAAPKAAPAAEKPAAKPKAAAAAEKPAAPPKAAATEPAAPATEKSVPSPAAAPAPAAPLPVDLLAGARVRERATREFDAYWVALGKLKGDGQAEQAEQVNGRWTHVELTAGTNRTVAEVLRHYEEQIAKNGFEVLYSCGGVECGEGGRRTNGDWWALSDHRRYLAARQRRPRGDLWVTVHVHARSATAPVEHEVDVVEAKPLVAPPPPRNEADVATLERELRVNGRVVLRSLGFSDGKPTVLPASDGVVRAIAELLTLSPGLKLHVVVHGDDTVPFAAGVELSKKRAAALVTLLKQRHKIAGGRVQPAGLGPLAPVGSNATEEGRALNRRVELVPEGGRESAAGMGRDR